MSRRPTVFLSLLLPVAALAIPDVCDEGGGAVEGDVPLATDADLHVAPDDLGDHMGRATALGDFDGDGVADLAVGADGVDVNGTNAGAVYIWFGPVPTTGTLTGATADVVVRGEVTGDQTGWALAAGDVDGDGADDLLIGSLAVGGASNGAGIAHLVSGQRLATDSDIDLATEADARFLGIDYGDELGSAVAIPGDLDGDGFADLVLGAPKAAAGGFKRGEAYVYYGPISGEHVVSDADASLRDDLDTSSFGIAIAGVGDVDGDGYTDLAIGAPRDDLAGSRSGAAFVFSGGSARLSGTLDTRAAFLRLHGGTYDRAGAAIAPAGDVDGDGYDDLWVGAKQFGSLKIGAVFLVRGGTAVGGFPLVGRAIFSAYGPHANALAGTSLAGAVDLDGDGTHDVVIGGERGAGSVVGSGAAWVLHGPFTGGGGVDLNLADATLRGTAYLDYASSALAAGDVDDDGFDDILVGAWRSSDFLFRSGDLAVVRGGRDDADLVRWYADTDFDGFGDEGVTEDACFQPPGYVEVGGDCDDHDPTTRPSAPEACSGPDRNCDGHVGPTDDDGDGFAACAGDCDDGDENVNPTALDLCGDGIDNDCNGEIDGATAADAIAWFVDGDGDGYGNRIASITACTRPSGGLNFIPTGGDCRDGDPTIHPNAPEYCDGLDNDCDGLYDETGALDAVVWYADADGDSFGNAFDTVRACVQPSLLTSEGWVDYVADASDCDDDDRDIHPGAVETCDLQDNDCDGAGYLGGTLDIVDHATLQLMGSGTTERFGQGGVHAVRDLDGDGIDDIVVALPGASDAATRGGVVLVRRGGGDGGPVEVDRNLADGLGGWDTKILGTRRDGNLGSDVAVGDFNGDGYNDLALGAGGARMPNVEQGAVFVFFGPLPSGTLQLDDANVTLRGEHVSSRAGDALAVGDLDGDFYDDLVIGAPQFRVGSVLRGKASVWYGGAAAAGRVDVSDLPGLVGTDDNGRLGNDVTVADLDGDGFGDLVASAPRAGNLERGAIAVVYGSATRPGGAMVADAVITGASNGSRTGVSVAGLGDVDGDGFDDLLVGSTITYAYLLRGDAARWASGGLAGRFQVRFIGPAGSQTGSKVAAPGDLNGDGLADLLISAVDDDQVGRDAGAVYVVYGRTAFEDVVPAGATYALTDLAAFAELAPGTTFPTLSAANLGELEGAKLLGAHPLDGFGAAVSGGDLDGDGFADLLIASSGWDTPTYDDAGLVALVRGGPFGTDLGVTDGTAATWWWDRDDDGYTDADGSFASCDMHVPTDLASGRLLATPAPSNQLDCDDSSDQIRPCGPEWAGDGVDSDCDGLDNPVPDADGDGLSMDDELWVYGTCPDLADTDGDGVDDGDEVARGSDPTDASDLIVGIDTLVIDQLRIVEIMANPAACAAGDGEYVEIVVGGSRRVDLAGLDLDLLSGTETLAGVGVVSPGDRLVLAHDAAGFQACYGFAPDGTFAQLLADSGDRIELQEAGRVVSALDFRAWALPPGIAWQRDPADPTGWCVAENASPSGDLGSPGAANDTCHGSGLADLSTLAPGDLQLTEILIDPANCTDGNGEYLELYYRGTEVIDLSGLVVSDTFSSVTLDNVSVLPDTRMVLARNASGYTACYGSSPLAVFGYDLDNNGELFTLRAPGGAVVDTIDTRGWTAAAGYAFERDDADGTWCMADSTGPSGDHGSPGVPNGACRPGDFDGDGIADADEPCLNLDPFHPDSDRDGALDGDELSGSFNPHGTSTRRGWRLAGTVASVTDSTGLLTGTVTVGDDLDAAMLLDGAVADGDVSPSQGTYTWTVPGQLEAEVRVGSLSAATAGSAPASTLTVTPPSTLGLSAVHLADDGGAFTDVAFTLTFAGTGTPLADDTLFPAPPAPSAFDLTATAQITVTQGGNSATITVTLDTWVGDADGDTLTDAEERALGLDPWSEDTDGDGLTDDQEVALGLLGCTADTDGDGFDDGLEVRAWSDPDDAGSQPRTVTSLLASEVRITEFMYDPATCGDADGEYTEVAFLGTTPVVLDGLQVRNQFNAGGYVSGGVVAQPGDLLVFARGPGFTNCYGEPPTAVVGTALANGGDRIQLFANSAVLAEVDFRSGFSLGAGFAQELDDLDTSLWCRAEDVLPRGDLGTPGRPNGFCPSPDDPDRDGLTTDVETCSGLDPNRFDSDNDGVGDGYELAAGTNPHGDEHLVGWRFTATTTGVTVTPPALDPGLTEWRVSVQLDTTTTDDNASPNVGDYDFAPGTWSFRAVADGRLVANVGAPTATATLQLTDGGTADNLQLVVEDDLDPRSGFTHVRFAVSLSGTGSGVDPLTGDAIPRGPFDMAGFDNTATATLDVQVAGGGSFRVNGHVDAVDADDDADTLSNAEEQAAGTDAWGDDSDGDGTHDGVESELALDLCSADSDGDGFDDTLELRFGTDPGDNGSTPRTANTLSAGELLITEAMVDPSVCTDLNGEYIELLYTGSERILLRGLRVSDEVNTRTMTADTIVEPGDRIVLGRTAGFETCYGFAPAGLTNLDLTNSGDLVRLSGDFGVIDELDFRASTGITIDPGVAIIVDDSIPGRVCGSTDSAPSGDQGSPGGANGSCPDPNDLDGDGLTNGEEVCLGTDPLLSDSDGDGVDDGTEIVRGTNPHGPDARRHWTADATVAAVADPDGLLSGVVDAGASIAVNWVVARNLADQDASVDVGRYTATDSRLDALLELPFVALDRGVGAATWDVDVAAGTWHVTLPVDGTSLGYDAVTVELYAATSAAPGPVDTDALPDALPDVSAFDSDLRVQITVVRGAMTATATASIDAWRADADRDGIDDATEVAQGSDPWNGDTDADGLPDADERSIGTAVCTPDTDADGFLDGVEVRAGTNPSSSTDKPLSAAQLTSGSVLITEFLATGTAACADADAEYVEVLYQGVRPAYLLGAELVDASGARRNLGDTVALPGQRVILARSLGFEGCYGFPPDGVTGLVLDNADRIRFQVGSTILDEVDYRTGPAFVVTAGQAKERDDSALWLWCDAEDALAPGMTGTPGTANGACPPDPDGDGLIFEVEACLGTDAYDADSDGDGIPDDVEVANGTNPHGTDDVIGWVYTGAVDGISGNTAILGGMVNNGDDVLAGFVMDATLPNASAAPNVTSFNMLAPDDMWTLMQVGDLVLASTDGPFLGSGFLGVDRTLAQPKLFWSNELSVLGTGGGMTANAGHEIQAASAPPGYGVGAMPHQPLSLATAASVNVSLHFVSGSNSADVGLTLYDLWRDDDLDGRSNGMELSAGTDPWRTDSDGDGLDDASEAAAGSNPCAIDSDGDGVDDASEVAAGTDPNDPASVP
ncbi:MAG: FG-GAP repeat protein [Alphaproteobacteria bacterium]|nr:FG-GAP repeat protein [Alphaproteobacteria bacterium]